jgi:hypothetical protein
MEGKDLKQEPLICLVCAWRKDCLKKYSFTGGQCLDFSRDVTVKLPEEEAEKEKSKKPS